MTTQNSYDYVLWMLLLNIALTYEKLYARKTYSQFLSIINGHPLISRDGAHGVLDSWGWMTPPNFWIFVFTFILFYNFHQNVIFYFSLLLGIVSDFFLKESKLKSLIIPCLSPSIYFLFFYFFGGMHFRMLYW